jgi:hypothetical protein
MADYLPEWLVLHELNMHEHLFGKQGFRSDGVALSLIFLKETMCEIGKIWHPRTQNAVIKCMVIPTDNKFA